MNFKELTERYDALITKKDSISKELDLQFQDTPSLEDCRKAVAANHYQIMYCKKRTQGLIRSALPKYPLAMLIGQQSEELCLEAIKLHGAIGLAFSHRKTPRLIEAALRSDPEAIAYIEDPSEHYQLQAVTHFPSALRFIAEPSDAVCTLAVKLNEEVLKYVPKSIIDNWRKLI